MEFDRKEILKLETALSSLGVLKMPLDDEKLNALETALQKPLEITTYYGRLMFHTIKNSGLEKLPRELWHLPLKEYPPGFPEHKLMAMLDDDFVKSDGMPFLASNSRFSEQNKVDVRDAEVVNRVKDSMNLEETLKDRYPKMWGVFPGDIRMDIFHYLVGELQQLRPDKTDFSETYAAYLTKQLSATVPNYRFTERMDHYHANNSQYHLLPSQVGFPVIFDAKGETLNREAELPVDKLNSSRRR